MIFIIWRSWAVHKKRRNDKKWAHQFHCMLSKTFPKYCMFACSPIGSLFGVFLTQICRRLVISSHKSLCSLFPNIPGLDSRGGGHKSHPLRDYTLLKAYDPGWIESRAMEGATGKTLEWLWLTHWLHSAPHSQPYKQVLLLESCRFDCWKSKSNLVFYIKFKRRVILYL